MKAIVVSEFGGPDVLKYKEIDAPTLGADEVRVRLHAAGVNPNEAYIRAGGYSFYTPPLPYTPGFDGAGEVDAAGSGVKHLKVGDRVFVAAMLAKRNTGTYAQKVVCDASAAHALPDTVSYREGAALGIPASAAYRALFHSARIRAGETVLIHGASGGLGLIAVQMASGIGARVIGTAGTDEGKRLVKASGAAHVTGHIAEGSFEEILHLTNGKGPDAIIEILANENLDNDLKILARQGRIVIVGNRGRIEIDPRQAMVKEAAILGMALWNASHKEYAESLCAIGAFLRSGVLHPEIGDELPLCDADKAHETLLNRKSRGKMILKID